MSHDSVQDLLRALAEADASVEAPPQIEARLMNEFRSRKRLRAWRRSALWAASAAAVIALIFVFAGRKSSVAPVNEDVVVSAPVITVPEVPAATASETPVQPSR